jgi:2-iminobutanoate/2-iminopropanoate deaminase
MRTKKGVALIWAGSCALLCFSLWGGEGSGLDQARAKREVFFLTDAPAGKPPYSPALKVGNLIFLSGAIGTDPKTGELVSPDIAGQTRQCLEKLKALLKQAGMDLNQAVSATVYLADIGDFEAMNKVYASYFPDRPPARTTVQVAGLAKGAKIEISMICAE